MRTVALMSMLLLATGCSQAKLEKEIAELRQENQQLKKQFSKTEKDLKQARETLVTLDGARQDLEIERRLAMLKLEQTRIAALRAAEGIEANPDGGTQADAPESDDQIAPAPTPEQEKLAKKYYEEAYVIKASNRERAIARLLAVMAMLPADHVYHQKAKHLLGKLNPDDPALASRQSPQVVPDDEPDDLPEVEDQGRTSAELRKLGIAAHKRKAYTEALAYYKKALEVDPKDYEMHRLIGTVYALMGKRKKAYQSYREYVESCPKCMYAPVVSKILKDYESLTP